MKKIALILFLFPLLVVGQDCEKIAQTQIVNKIKSYKPKNLLPYSDDGKKWGLFDKKSKRKVTETIFSGAETFSPSLIVYINNCGINISRDNKTYNLKISTPKISAITASSDTSEKRLEQTEDIGFQVDENGNMISYSKTYSRFSIDSWNISKAFEYNGAYYAIVYTKEKHYFINQKGEEQTGISFKRIYPYPVTCQTKGEKWFYYEDFDKKSGIVNLKGERKFHGELTSFFLNDSDFGYSVQNSKNGQNENLSGVLDLTTMEWHIKPQKEYEIRSIIYTSSEKIKNRKKAENRSKAVVYFIIKKDGKYCVINTKGKIFEPKK